MNRFDKGIIISLKDAIAEVTGLKFVQSGELVQSKLNYGLVLNLNQKKCGIVFFSDLNLKVGQIVSRTFELASLSLNAKILGAVVDALGFNLKINFLVKYSPLNYLFADSIRRMVEVKAPGILIRKSVYESLLTGLKVIDATIPCGLGQRELVIGDRQIGKTAIAVDAIINIKYNI